MAGPFSAARQRHNPERQRQLREGLAVGRHHDAPLEEHGAKAVGGDEGADHLGRRARVQHEAQAAQVHGGLLQGLAPAPRVRREDGAQRHGGSLARGAQILARDDRELRYEYNLQHVRKPRVHQLMILSISHFRGRANPARGRRESKGSELVSLLEGLVECGNAEDQVHIELVGIVFISLPTSTYWLHPDLHQPLSLHQGGF